MGIAEVICGLAAGVLSGGTVPKLPSYVVDPAKVTTFLWGVSIATGEAVKQRAPGYVIDTGIRIDIIGGVKWLITEAGYRYALDYLKVV